MQPDDLLECRVCGARSRMLGAITLAQKSLGETTLEAVVALGEEAPEVGMLSAARAPLRGLWSKLYHDGMACDGDETEAHPINDSGYLDF